MSLQFRMLIPILLMALLGLGATAVLSWRALSINEQARIYQDDSAELSEAVKVIAHQADMSDDELHGVMEMSTLFDIDASWQLVKFNMDDITNRISVIDALSVSAEMRDLNGKLKIISREFMHDAAKVYGMEAAPEVPTRELITRLTEQMKAVSDQMLHQAALDRTGFETMSNAKFNDQVQVMAVAVLAISLVVILGSVFLVQRTAKKIRAVAANLAHSSGNTERTDGAFGRDEIANLQNAAQSFAQRATALAAFQTELGVAVDAAVAGDFSRRL